MNKYRAQRTEVDGITFHSKREAKHYADLKYAKLAGEVLWFIRQPIFDLPGGVQYHADFLEVWKGGDIRITDVKGYDGLKNNAVYRIKKKQTEAIYGITILEV